MKMRCLWSLSPSLRPSWMIPPKVMRPMPLPIGRMGRLSISDSRGSYLLDSGLLVPFCGFERSTDSLVISIGFELRYIG